MMYDFVIILNYMIFFDLLFVFELMCIMQGDLFFVFNFELLLCYGIVLCYGDNLNICWFEGLFCYMFYMLNVWDDGDEVVFVGCCMEMMLIVVFLGYLDQDGVYLYDIVLVQEDVEFG